MDIVKCPKCKKPVTINIANSVTEDGEVYMCPHCKFEFRYVKENIYTNKTNEVR
jgi:uncharacterized protein YbaR (Trm112 family)